MASERSSKAGVTLLISPDVGLISELETALDGKPDRLVLEGCTSTRQALDRLRESDYDVVLTDAAMLGPHQDRLIEQIRQAHPRTPIIVISTAQDRPLAVRALGDGAYAVMTTPLDPDYVAACVTGALRVRRLAREVDAQKEAIERHADELERLVQQRTAELQRKDQEQRILFNSVPAMIWYKDRHNRILRVNESAAASLGLRVEDVEGKSTYELYPDEADQYHKDDLEVIATGKPKLGIIEPYQTGEGHKRWVRTDKVPYRDEQGEVVGVIVFAVDLTDCLDRFARSLGEKVSKRGGLQGKA